MLSEDSFNTIFSFGESPEIDLHRISETDKFTRGNLSDIAIDWFLVAPAIPYLTIDLPVDLVNAYEAEKSKKVALKVCSLERDFCDYSEYTKELPTDMDHFWNRTLLAMPREIEESYLAWVGSLAFSDRKNKTLYMIRTQPLKVLDCRLYSGVQIPDRFVTVTGLVVETNKCSYFYKTQPNGELRVVKSKDVVFEDTKSLAEELFKD